MLGQFLAAYFQCIAFAHTTNHSTHTNVCIAVFMAPPAVQTIDWPDYARHANALLDTRTPPVLLLFVADDDPATGLSWCPGAHASLFAHTFRVTTS